MKPDLFTSLLISGAETIDPADVQIAIFGHPDIDDIATIGVRDETWGEAVKAVVVLRPDATTTIDNILEFTRTRIAAYKVPKSIGVVTA